MFCINWLIGSYAQGTMLRGSDIDISINVDYKLPPKFLAILTQKLTKKLQIQFGQDKVELHEEQPQIQLINDASEQIQQSQIQFKNDASAEQVQQSQIQLKNDASAQVQQSQIQFTNDASEQVQQLQHICGIEFIKLAKYPIIKYWEKIFDQNNEEMKHLFTLEIDINTGKSVETL